jgi:hypothetical protein
MHDGLQPHTGSADAQAAMPVADQRLHLTIKGRAELLPADHRTGSGMACNAYDD